MAETETSPTRRCASDEAVRAGRAAGTGQVAIDLEVVNLSYGDNHVLHDISMDIGEKMVTAFIGPSGCGKSTLLRCLNRMNDLIDGTSITGTVKVKGLDLYAPGTDVIEVRRRIGMVFQKSNPSQSPSTRTWSTACASRASRTGPP